MKKLLCVLLMVCLIPFAVLAETDLKSMSYDELIRLNQAVEREIMSRPEWKEVSVPGGVWRVGEDIPAGTYSIKTDKRSANFFVWKRAKDDYSDGGLVYNELIRKDEPYGKVTLTDGMVVECDAVIFAPPMTLGF